MLPSHLLHCITASPPTRLASSSKGQGRRWQGQCRKVTEGDDTDASRAPNVVCFFFVFLFSYFITFIYFLIDRAYGHHHYHKWQAQPRRQTPTSTHDSADGNQQVHQQRRRRRLGIRSISIGTEMTTGARDGDDTATETYFSSNVIN